MFKCVLDNFWIIKAKAYFEEGKVDLFSVSILLFVNTRVEILHI